MQAEETISSEFDNVQGVQKESDILCGVHQGKREGLGQHRSANQLFRSWS